MEPDFWHQRWQKSEIAFHQSEANPYLVKFFGQLQLTEDSRVFVPLCGKTLDIGWLLSRGYRVAGVELSEMAIEELFAQLELQPEISEISGLKRYSAPRIDIFVGDFFGLNAEVLGPVDAVFDRAALVALPPDMRQRYTAHFMKVTGRAPQLLITYDYDQSRAAGPPFSVPGDEVSGHYGDHYRIELVFSQGLPNSSRGSGTKEDVWRLSPSTTEV